MTSRRCGVTMATGRAPAGARSGRTGIIQGIVIVGLFAVATLYAAHERMHVVPGATAGKGEFSDNRRMDAASGLRAAAPSLQLIGASAEASSARPHLESVERLQHMLGSVHNMLDAVKAKRSAMVIHNSAQSKPPTNQQPLKQQINSKWEPRLEPAGHAKLTSSSAPQQRFEKQPDIQKSTSSHSLPLAKEKSPFLSPSVQKPAIAKPAIKPEPKPKAGKAPPAPEQQQQQQQPSMVIPEDQIFAKAEKPFDGDFILDLEQRKPGSLLKQPKHLSQEGQLSRAKRGKVEAASRSMKWQHIGFIDKSWKDAGFLPLNDEIRKQWLPEFGKPTSTCAVVGNGGGLLGMEAGSEIDKHDVVIRFNGGPVRGFERFVGRKTTFRLTNLDHFAFSDIGDETILQHVTNTNGTAVTTKYAKQVLKMKKEGTFGQDPHDSARFRIISPDFHYLVMELFSYGAPSNGFYGTVLAGELCASVTMYGFQKSWKGTTMPYHYYNDVEPNESQFGRDNNEATFFGKWLAAVNAQARENPHWLEWRRLHGWAFEKFVFAEQRHSNLPRLDIDLKAVPWKDTGFSLDEPAPLRLHR